MPQRLHAALIEATQRDRLIGHVSRDSTAIEARERFPGMPRSHGHRKAGRPAKASAKKKRANRHKASKASERGTQIARQRCMTLDQMIAGLPIECAVGVKKSSKGHLHYWRGYKLHLDVADGQIPISAILTGANVHGAVVAIPLMTMTARRVTRLYDLMDSAYDADILLEQSRKMDDVPIVNPHPRRAGRSQSILPKVFPQKRFRR